MELYIPAGMTVEKVQAILTVLPGNRNKDYVKAANLMIEKNTYMIPPFGSSSYSNLINWNEQRERGYLRLIHGHTFLGCLIAAYNDTGDMKYIKKSIELIKDWINNHSFELHQHSMAFHDETTALRLQYWLRFYIFTRQVLSEEEIILLEKSMEDTAKLLSEDFFHATNTNHGVFQDRALLTYASYFKGENPSLEKYIKLAVTRLKDYFEKVFTEEGVHKEHSPSYHLLVASNIKKLANWMKEFDKEVSLIFNKIYKKTEEYAIHIIRPDGSLPPICDTEANLVGNNYKDLYESDQYLYAVTKGKKGKAPTEDDKVFPKSGYAIFRNDWSKEEKATYVLFTAAYHVDYHKHSDDLNLYIYSNGEIITEAGPNGYNYKDPFTEYAYSSFAHNTLIVDGKGLPRTDRQYEKVYLSDYEINKDKVEATGINLRYTGVEHSRTVSYMKDEEKIVVKDLVKSDKRHEYKLLWHVASDITVHVRDRIVELFRNNHKVMEMEVTTVTGVSIRALNEQTKPQVSGWVFPKMGEKRGATTIEVDISGSNVECITEFRLKDFKLGRDDLIPYNLEKTFKSTRNLRYHFEEAKNQKHKDKLFVVFSAMAPEYKFAFNYMRSLKDVDVNKLFILDDFGDQGAYYLGNKRDHAIETAVSSLIQYIMAKYKICHEQVTAIGSSKGGYAAVYFALKYYFGNVIAGAPQSKLGHFLINQANHKNIARYIAGGDEESDCFYLDQLVFQLLNQPNDISPSINLIVGTKDHHYLNHVMPLYEVLVENGYEVQLEIEEDLTHADLKVHFPLYLQNKVEEILDKKHSSLSNFEEPIIHSIDIRYIEGSNIILTCDATGSNIHYAYYVYKDGHTIDKFMYTMKSHLYYELKDLGEYMFKVFVKDQYNRIITKTFKFGKV